MERLAALHDPRKARSLWLAHLAELASDTMRSSAFLAMMRLNLTLLTQPTLVKATQMIALPTTNLRTLGGS
jgi:hypothetical protein